MHSICILTTAHPTSDQRIFHKQAKTLVKRGFDVKAIAHHNKTGYQNDIKILSLGNADSRVNRWRNIYKTYRMAVRIDADVYHFHDPELLPVGALLACRTDGQVIYDAHEYYPDAIYMREWIPYPIRAPLSRVFPAIESAFAQQIDAIITADEPTSEAFRQRGHNQVVTIRNFPRTESITIDPSIVERNHEHLLSYVGQLSSERGLFRMLKLVARLQADEDIGLWLLGGFKNDETKRRTQAFIADHNLEKHIRLFGRVNYEEIFSYLAATDLGLALLDRERCQRNVPTKLFEYMLSGLPVVATRGRSIKRYLDREIGVFVPENDTEAQATLIADLLANEIRRSEMGTQAAKRARSNYSWECEEERLLNLYMTLVA